MSNARSKNRLDSIQILRALAATLVVWLHAKLQLVKYGMMPENNWDIFAVMGGVGVDLFFVISGFIMVYTTLGENKKPGAPGRFMARRLIRILPIYWVYTALILALLLLFPSWFGALKPDLWHSISSFLLIPARNNLGETTPLINVAWTLSYEMYFYLLFAMLLWLPRAITLPALALIFICSVLPGLRFMQNSIPGVFFTNPLLLQFLLGCLAAVMVKYPALTGRIAITAFFISSLLIYHATFSKMPVERISRILGYGVPAMLLLFSFVVLEQRGKLHLPKIVVALGNSSYSLYLTHLFVLVATGKILAMAGLLSMPPMVFFTLLYLLALIGGHIAYLLIEKPLTKKLQARYIRTSHH